MIRKPILLGVVLLLGLTAFAQEYPKVELGVDYTYARYNPSHAYVKNGYSLNGAGGSVNFNINKYLGIKMDLQGYGSNTKTFTAPAGTSICPGGCSASLQANLFTYMFGPQLGLRTGKFRPFTHLLLGGAHSNVYNNLKNLPGVTLPNPAGNTFAMAFGGGIDFPLNHSGTIAIRPAEVDYLYTRFNNSVTGAQGNFRYSGGIVFNFGGK